MRVLCGSSTAISPTVLVVLIVMFAPSIPKRRTHPRRLQSESPSRAMAVPDVVSGISRTLRHTSCGIFNCSAKNFSDFNCARFHQVPIRVKTLRHMSLLTVQNLSVRIDGKLIVDDVSFELAPRERLSILGPNGAGKTVLLKALLKLLPYSGEIEWAPEVRIGYVPQKIDAEVHLPLTFNDLFRSKCRTLGVGVGELDELCASVGLTREMRNTPVG